MENQIEKFLKAYKKSELPDVRPGDVVKIYQKVPSRNASQGDADGKKEEQKETIQIFEGQVLARKHGKEIGATITVRKNIAGVMVEKIFPLHLPSIEKIEVIKKARARRAKLYYLRTAKGDRAKIKEASRK